MRLKFAVTGLALFLIAGCNTADVAKVLDGTSMNAKVDGALWESQDGAHHISDDVTGGILVSGGVAGNSGTLSILTVVKEGSYSVNHTAFPMVTYTKGSTVFHSYSGKITITHKGETYIEGTFEADLAENLDGTGSKIKITDGVFTTRGR